MTYVLLTVCLLLSVVQHARAAPDATATYLMNTPVSLMDFGIFKMEQDLKEFFLRTAKENVEISVGYMSDENKFEVRIFDQFDQRTPDSREKAVSRCQSLVNMARGKLGVNRKTGKMEAPAASPSWAYFLGFAESRIPKSKDRDIERMIRIEAQVSSSSLPQKFATVKCTAPLLGTEVFVAQ